MKDLAVEMAIFFSTNRLNSVSRWRKCSSTISKKMTMSSMKA